jgi:PAS domain S-box-containing protein
MVEAAPNAMVMINADGLIELVNAQAEQVFGYVRAELLGRSIETLVPARFCHQHPSLRNGYFTAPCSRPMGAGRELFGLRKDGSEFPVEIGLNPIDTDEGTMVLSAIVDISDRRQKEERIRLALKEKEILLGEVHHRVKNNLQIIYSLLELQSARVTDSAALDLLRDSQNRVRSMAQIHQTLYQSKNFAEVDIALFLDTLVPSLITSYVVNAELVSITVRADQVLLPIDAAIPCGLLVNELVSNALKHAFPDGRAGTITVTLNQRDDGEVVLSVSDDGVGIPAHIDIAAAPTLGLQLVTLLSDQLGGRFEIQRSGPTRCIVCFPIAKSAGGPR